MKQCVGYMLEFLILTPGQHRLVITCRTSATVCLHTADVTWFLNEGLSQALVCSWSIIVSVSNSSYIKHSLWALCDLYLNVEGWRIVFNQLSTAFIPDTGRVHSLLIFFYFFFLTANLPVCTASRITVQYVFNLGKGPCANYLEGSIQKRVDGSLSSVSAAGSDLDERPVFYLFIS